MNLFQLTAEFIDLANRLGDEPSEADLDAIAATEEALREKAGSYVAVWRQLETEAEGMKAEADRLAELARKRRAGAQRLKDWLVANLDRCGIKSLPTPLGRLSVANASRPSIRWEGLMDDLPDEFQKIEVKLDSDAALEAYKRGHLPSGFRVSVSRYVRVS